MRQFDAQRYRTFGARPLLVVGELAFGIGIDGTSQPISESFITKLGDSQWERL